MKLWRELWRHHKLAALSLCAIALIAAAGLFAPLAAPHHPEAVNMGLRYASPSWSYPLGNDQLGRCVLSRLIYGIRPSVLWVFAALALSAGIGAAAGFAAGFLRGRTDAVLMRVCDVMLSFPGYVTVLAVIGVMGTGLEQIMLAFVVMKWAWFARVFRTSVMRIADADYVKFARATGAGGAWIIGRHLVPVALPELAVVSSSSFGSMILQLSGFSFLGLGVQAPRAEWGMMLNEAREVMFSRPELLLAPGLAIVLVVSAVNVLTDALQAAWDPKLRHAGGRQSERALAADAKLHGREVA